MPKGIKLTPKQKKFADKYIELGNATEAAAQVYKPKNRNTAGAIGTENLKKPLIKGYIEADGHEAQEIIQDIMRKEKAGDKTRLEAAKFVVEQVFGKATQKIEGGVDVNLTVKVVKYGIEDNS